MLTIMDRQNHSFYAEYFIFEQGDIPNSNEELYSGIVDDSKSDAYSQI